MGEDEVALSQFNGHIICEPPNSNLSRFEGTMEWEGRKYAIGKLYTNWWNFLFSELFINKIFEYTFVTFEYEQTILKLFHAWYNFSSL